MTGDRVVVIGAGLAGVTCARTLHRAGAAVRVLDRGRRAGGRMAGRRVDGRPVDLGASYFTVEDESFAEVVDDWQRRGLARPWTATFDVAGREPTSGPVRWAAAGGLRSLVEDLAVGLDLTLDSTVGQVRRTSQGWLVDGLRASAVVLAMPDPQARRLLAGEVVGRLPDPMAYEPVLALVATWRERCWDFDGLFVNDHPVLSFLADDGARRGDGAPVLVAHSTPAFAARHLADPAGSVPELAAAVSEVAGLPTPTSVLVHRWTFARPTGSRSATYALTGGGLGLCGDGWAVKPRVEAAYRSGRDLAEALLAR